MFQTEKWYRETNDYLVRVNQMCSYAQRDEKEALLNEVQGRIHSSQLDQEERLKRLVPSESTWISSSTR